MYWGAAHTACAHGRGCIYLSEAGLVVCRPNDFQLLLVLTLTQTEKGESKQNNAFSANNKKTTTSATTVKVRQRDLAHLDRSVSCVCRLWYVHMMVATCVSIIFLRGTYIDSPPPPLVVKSSSFLFVKTIMCPMKSFRIPVSTMVMTDEALDSAMGVDTLLKAG